MCSGGPSGKKGWQKKNNHKGDGMPGLFEADQLQKKNYKKQTPNSLGTPIVPFHSVPAARTGTSVVTPSVCNPVAKRAMPIVAGNRKTEPETE